MKRCGLQFFQAPKYGSDNDYADSWAKRLLVAIYATISNFRDAWGYEFTLDGSTATGYSMLGLVAGASPDGRKAGTPLADGTNSPMFGTDTEGPTAVLNSAAKIPYMHPALLNQRFFPQFLEGKNQALFAAYLKAWARLGRHSSCSIQCRQH